MQSIVDSYLNWQCYTSHQLINPKVSNENERENKQTKKSIEYVFKSRFHQFINPVNGTKYFSGIYQTLSRCSMCRQIETDTFSLGYVWWKAIVSLSFTNYTLYSLSLTRKKEKNTHKHTPPPINFYAKPKMRLDIINYGLTMLSIFK